MGEYTLEQYDEAKSLYAKTANYNEVARALRVPPSTIQLWLKTDAKPRRFSQKFRQNILIASRVMAQRRTRQLPADAKTLTPIFGYILGAVKGDGCINGGYPYRNRVSKNYVIALSVIDYDFASAFWDALKRWSGMNVTMNEVVPRKKTWRNQWTVRLYSNKAGKYLKEYDITKLQNAEEAVIAAFLRGFYDAEGGAYFNGKRVEVSVWNTDHALMKLVESLLYKVGIEKLYWCTDIRRQTPCYRISLNSRKEIRTFATKVGFSIKRKNNKLESIVNAPNMRGKWLRNTRK